MLPALTAESASPESRRTALHLALIALAIILIYSNSFEVPFLFDDARFITRNPVVTNPDFFHDSSGLKELAE